MEIRVIDFEVLTRNFQTYVDGYNKIEIRKKEMLNSIEPKKKEMEDILKKAQSNLNIDEVTQQKDVNRYKEIQQELMKLDNDFNRELKNMSNDLQTKVFDQLSEIITEWSTKNSINLVMGKMEIIFNTNDIDATEDILNIIKEKGLYYADAVNAETIKPIQ